MGGALALKLDELDVAERELFGGLSDGESGSDSLSGSDVESDRDPPVVAVAPSSSSAAASSSHTAVGACATAEIAATSGPSVWSKSVGSHRDEYTGPWPNFESPELGCRFRRRGFGSHVRHAWPLNVAGSLGLATWGRGAFWCVVLDTFQGWGTRILLSVHA